MKTQIKERVLVIGDIHSRLPALKDVLNKCNYNSDNDKLIFLGDYVDGFEHAFDTVEYLIKLKKKGKCVFIRGNHDQWVTDWLNGKGSNSVWLLNRGQSTYDDYIQKGETLNKEHADFFNSLQLFHVDDENRGFVHGGYSSLKGLGNEEFESEYYWNRDLALNLFNSEKTKAHKEIYVGHTPVQSVNQKISIPLTRGNITMMDTGGGFEKGVLTVMDINSKEFWNSSKV